MDQEERKEGGTTEISGMEETGMSGLSDGELDSPGHSGEGSGHFGAGGPGSSSALVMHPSMAASGASSSGQTYYSPSHSPRRHPKIERQNKRNAKSSEPGLARQFMLWHRGDNPGGYVRGPGFTRQNNAPR